MNSRIDGNAIALQSYTSPGSQRETAAQTGTRGGVQMTVKDAASALADAAEELSLHNSEKVDSKRFGDRSWKAEMPLQLQQIEDITAYLDAAKTLDDPQKLAALAKRMQSGDENPRELARRESRDPAGQFMLLQYALLDGEKNGASPAALEDIRDAIADLEMAAGPQIRAGLNTIAVAAGHAPSAEGIAEFQSTYQDVVLGQHSLAQTLNLMLTRLGGPDGADLKRGIQSMVQALGADLAAARPSTDANRLQALVADLYHLEVATTVLEGSQKLSNLLSTKHGSAGVKPADLMKELVSVTNEKWVGAQRISGLGEKFGVQDIAGRIAFQAGVKELLRAMPVKVFPDADTRQSILTAAQEALDLAIDKEDDA